MANRFKDLTLRKEYDAAMWAYNNRPSAIFRKDGSRHNGNTVAYYFWMGFDNQMAERWDKSSRNTLMYAYWRAGQDAAKKEQL